MPRLRPWIPALLRVLLLFAEIALVLWATTIEIDPAAPEIVKWVLRLTGHLFPLTTAIVVAFFLFGRSELRNEIPLARTSLRSWRAARPFLLLQILSFWGFFWFAASVLPRIQGMAHALAWTVLGSVLAAATGVLWCLSLFPALVWIRLARKCRIGLALGVFIGGSGYLAGLVTITYWKVLSGATLWMVRALLGSVLDDIVYDPSSRTIGTPEFTVVVGAACSGFEGMSLGCVFLTAYLWLFRKNFRFPHALLALPAGAGLLWFGNAFRIALLVVVGTVLSPEIAMGGFHSHAGWLFFVAIMLAVIAAAETIPLLHTKSASVSASSPASPTAAYLGPMLAIMAVATITGMFSDGFDWFYPLRVVAAVTVLCLNRRAYPKERWTCSLPAIGFGVLASCAWLAFAGETTDAADSWPVLAPGWAGVWLLFRIAGYVMAAPIAEELAFRGYLLRRLQSRDFLGVPHGSLTWVSLAISAVLFGAMHGRNLVPGTLAGIAFGLAFMRRGAVCDAVQAHMAANAVLMSLALGAGNWSRWG